MRSSSSATDNTVGKAKRLQVRDFLVKDGVAVDSPDDELSMEDTLLKGTFLHRELRQGLFLHASDVIEERAFTATSVLKEGLSCIFFLEGTVDLTIGDRSFAFRGDRRHATRGAAIMSASPERFRRSSNGRQSLRHLVVSASPEWLNVGGLAEMREERRTSALLSDHLADHRWTLSPRVVDLVHQILEPSSLVPELQNLYLEGRAVEIVVETIAAIMKSEKRDAGGSLLGRHDLARLQRATDLIAANLTQPLSVEAIAREAGTSASGLQRLFRASKGKSVFEYVRQLRLERAASLLKAGHVSVQEASAIAGYTNPANFATAFKRQFGMTPRQTAMSSKP